MWSWVYGYKCSPVEENPKFSHVTVGGELTVRNLNLGFKYPPDRSIETSNND